MFWWDVLCPRYVCTSAGHLVFDTSSCPWPSSSHRLDLIPAYLPVSQCQKYFGMRKILQNITWNVKNIALTVQVLWICNQVMCNGSCMLLKTKITQFNHVRWISFKGVLKAQNSIIIRSGSTDTSSVKQINQIQSTTLCKRWLPPTNFWGRPNFSLWPSFSRKWNLSTVLQAHLIKGEVNPIFFIPPLGQNWAS